MTRFVDTNVFLRALVRDDEAKWKRSLELFGRAERGEERLLTSESVVAEIVYVLSSPVLYSLLRTEVTARVRPFIEVRGLHVDHKTRILTALDRYETTNLDFEDCLSVDYALDAGCDAIYSHDRGFDRVPGVTRIEP